MARGRLLPFIEFRKVLSRAIASCLRCAIRVAMAPPRWLRQALALLSLASLQHRSAAPIVGMHVDEEYCSGNLDQPGGPNNRTTLRGVNTTGVRAAPAADRIGIGAGWRPWHRASGACQRTRGQWASLVGRQR